VTGGDCITRNFMILTKYYSGDQINNNKMGKAYDIYIKKKRCHATG